MTKVEALHEVITALGGTPAATTVAGCIAEITTIKGGAPTAGASTSEAIHELALALGYEPPTPTVTYTVTFSLNGGSGTAPSPATVDAGETVELPDDTGMTPPEGKTFAGWAESAESTTAVADPYTPAADITLHAIWREV